MKNLEKVKEQIKKFQQGGKFNYRIAANIANQYSQSGTPFKKNYFTDDPWNKTYEQNPKIADKNVMVTQTNPGSTNQGYRVFDQKNLQTHNFTQDFMNTVFNPHQVPSPQRPSLVSQPKMKPNYLAKGISMRKKGGKL